MQINLEIRGKIHIFVKRNDMEKCYSVWVGGIEVNDFLLTKKQAEDMARSWRAKGYDDVVIDNYNK